MNRPAPFACRAVLEELVETQPGFLRVVCRVPRNFPDPVPGQFVRLTFSENADPLLPRPYGVAGFHRDRAGGHIELYCGVVGKGTRLLAAMKPGREIPCLGPLGRGFTVEPTRNAVLVAGGRGVAPLLMLYAALKAGRPRLPFVYGFRTGALGHGVERIAPEDRYLATDDGSVGFHGTALDRLASLPPDLLRGAVICACGPEALLQGTARLALARGVSCQVSMETFMACGIGLCRGCAVPAAGRDGYLMCCSDGPVFDAREVAWEVAS